MTAPSLPWFEPQFGVAERDAVAAVFDSGYLNDGEVTRAFERAFAARLGVRHAVAVSNGTAAIALGLMAAGIGPGDEVLVPNFTFIATANAVRLAGAAVKLVDIDPRTLTISVLSTERNLSSATRAIVPVDVNGRGADYSALGKLCDKWGLVLISDSCEALGSHFHGQKLGTYGKAGCFSFSANKTVSCGQGGMIVTNDADLHDRLRELKDQGRREGGTGGDDLHPVIGYNFKLTNLQAAVGLAQLEQLHTRLDHARLINRFYREGLSGLQGVELLPLDDEGTVLQWNDVLIDDRARVCQALDAAGIGYRRFWHPLNTQEPYAAPSELFPYSQRVSSRGLWLPSGFSLSEGDVNRVCQLVQRAVSGLPQRRTLTGSTECK